MDWNKRREELMDVLHAYNYDCLDSIEQAVDLARVIVAQEKQMLSESEKAKAELLEAIEDCLRYSKMKEECVICVGACSRTDCYINGKRKLIQKYQETN